MTPDPALAAFLAWKDTQHPDLTPYEAAKAGFLAGVAYATRATYAGCAEGCKASVVATPPTVSAFDNGWNSAMNQLAATFAQRATG